jgi:hypothetical protein
MALVPRFSRAAYIHTCERNGEGLFNGVCIPCNM